MKASNTAWKIAALAALAALLQGCASAPAQTLAIEPTMQNAPIKQVLHRVKPHERLGDIAIQHTGTATNWEKIARYNGISNPRHLRVGAMIAIPPSLLLQNIEQTATASNQKKDLQLVAAARPNATTNATTTATNSLAVKRSSSRKSGDVVLEPVRTNRAFELNPIKKSAFANQTQSNRPAAKVQIVGTYYPKGIYGQPANYSDLVMRAAPGTLFELEYLANDWYKIVTDKGFGYLRKDDGKVVSLQSQPQ